MTTYVGNDGIVKVSSDSIGELRSWSLEESADTIEDTVMGDTWKSRQSSHKSFSGSADVYWDPDDTAQTALTIGSEVTLKLYPEGDTSGDVELTGSAIVTGLTTSASHDGMVETSFTFEGNGALTKGTVV